MSAFDSEDLENSREENKDYNQHYEDKQDDLGFGEFVYDDSLGKWVAKTSPK
jgi:hypothetical protein